VDGPPGVAVDEEPVADEVEEVRGNEGGGDGTDVVEGLEVAAEGEVEEERRGSPVEGAEEGDGSGEDLMVDGEAEHDQGCRGDDGHEDGSEGCGEQEAVVEPAVGFVEMARSVGLGEVGVEAEKDSGDAEGEGVVEDLSESCGGDGESRVRHVADHDGVHDAHRHPAELGCDERQGEGEHRADLLADGHEVGLGCFPTEVKSSFYFFVLERRWAAGVDGWRFVPALYNGRRDE